MTNELYKRVIDLLLSVKEHRYCEDGFYACPKSESYFGEFDSIPSEQRPCYCNGDDAAQLLVDMQLRTEHPHTKDGWDE